MTMTLGYVIRNVVVLVAIVILAYAGVCLFLFFSQRSMIYQPQRSAVKDPSESVMLEVPGATLQITVRPHSGAKALIYFGGNAENVSLSLPEFSEGFPDRALFLMHYRGYEGSSGRPSEQAIQSDALALYDKVRVEHPDVAVVGRSLGSGVAVRLASLRPVAGLVLVTPYSSIQDIAEERFAYFPVRWLLKDKFESWRYAPAIKTPTLLLAAENDAVIPLSSTQKLYRAFLPGVASLKILPFFGHNDISSSPVYLQDIRDALASATGDTYGYTGA
jgi:pimeloyl-ACP methyl ester carboxylesterase